MSWFPSAQDQLRNVDVRRWCTMQLKCSGILSICIDNLIFFNFWLVLGILGGESLECTVGSLGGETTGAELDPIHERWRFTAYLIRPIWKMCQPLYLRCMYSTYCMCTMSDVHCSLEKVEGTYCIHGWSHPPVIVSSRSHLLRYTAYWSHQRVFGLGDHWIRRSLRESDNDRLERCSQCQWQGHECNKRLHAELSF